MHLLSQACPIAWSTGRYDYELSYIYIHTQELLNGFGDASPMSLALLGRVAWTFLNDPMYVLHLTELPLIVSDVAKRFKS